MVSRNSGRWKIALLAALFLVAIGLGIYAYSGGSLASLFPGERPSVLILEPKGEVSLYSGQGVYVTALGLATEGVARIEFALEDQVLETHEQVGANEPAFSTHFVWFSSAVGQQTLSIIAYDRNGIASEASRLTINVYPRLSAQADGQDSNQGLTLPPPEEVSLLDAFSAQAAADNAAQAQEAPAELGGGADAEQPAGQAEDGQPADEPPAPLVDNPPSLRVFEYDLSVVGNDVVINLVAAAEDDLGLNRVEFHLRPNNGAPIDFAQFCGGHVSCETGGELVLPPGEWLLSAQAFDTSGQASEAELHLAEVLGGNGQPPAAAEHDLEFVDPLADLELDFPLGSGDFGQGFDLEDFLAGRLGAEREPVESSGNCAELSLQPAATSVELEGRATCDLRTDGQHFLFVNVGKRILHQGDGGRSLSFPDWFDGERRQIAAGETFTTRITGLQCGAEYEFSFRVDNAQLFDNGQMGQGANFAFVSQVIETLPCSNRSVADINLKVVPSGESAVQATWQAAPNGAWPASIEEAGVTFYLMRYQEQMDELVVIDRFDLTRDELLAGRDFSLLDDRLQCGLPYWYSVVVHLAGQQQPRFVTPIIQPNVYSEGIPCPGAELAGIDLNISSHWTPGDDEYFVAEAHFPANYAWPHGEPVMLKLQVLHVGGECQAPCEDGWGVRAQVAITEQIRGHEFVMEQRVNPRCGPNQYQLRLVMSTGGQNVDFGPIATVDAAPCPPSPPDMVSLHGASGAACPGNAAHCVTISWQPFAEPALDGYASPAAYLILERDNSFGESTAWRLDLDETQFVDTSPTMQVRANLCTVPRMYRIFAYDANGRTAGASPLSINDLSCNGAWNFLVEPRR